MDGGVQPFLIGEGWIVVRDGDASCRAIFDRHYSRYLYADGRRPKLFMGPGEKMALLRADGRALFAWRKFLDDSGQKGINCAIYRNEGDELGEALILEAEVPARSRWPGERFYTYVDPRKVKPKMTRGRPVWGLVFYRAGWHFVGLTKGGLHILAKEPA